MLNKKVKEKYENYDKGYNLDKIPSSKKILLLHQFIVTRLENYHLTVTLVKEEDGGEYEVKAENEMGSVSTKSTVTVHSKYINTSHQAKL